MPAVEELFLPPSFLAAEDVAAERPVELLVDHRPVGVTINAIYPHRRYLSAKIRASMGLAADRFG